jgi:cytoskeleton protein RodZ
MAESLGTRLRTKREALHLSLEDAEGRICIRAKHLQAIEADDLTQFSSAAQAKGFIRTYALFLDVPFDPETHPVGATRPTPAAPTFLLPPEAEPAPKRKVAYDGMPKPSTGPRRALTRWLRMEVAVIILAGLMVFGLFAWGVNSMIVAAYTTPSPTPTQVVTPTATVSLFAATQTMLASEAVAATAAPSVAPSGIPGIQVTARPTLYPTPQGGVYNTVHIRILVQQSTYLKVDVDDKTVFAQRVQEGDAFEFDGTRIITIATGNAAALRVFFNGVDQGLLGSFGEIVTRSWNLSGAVQLTATPTPTLAASPSIAPSRTPAR